MFLFGLELTGCPSSTNLNKRNVSYCNSNLTKKYLIKLFPQNGQKFCMSKGKCPYMSRYVSGYLPTSIYIYTRSSETVQIFTISNHYYYGNLYSV